MATTFSTARVDTLRHAETPEGVSLEIRCAGPVVRSWAWVIDNLLRLAIYVAVFSSFAVLGDFGIGLALIVIFMVEWFYPVVFEMFNQGATPGKKALGLRVVRDDGLPVDWAASMIRNILRAVDFLPVGYAAGLIAMLLNRDFKRLGDMVAGTVVIYLPSDSAASDALPHAPPVALKHELQSAEQRALVEYARRSAAMSADRADELAATLDPLFSPPTATAGRKQRLIGAANSILGRRE